MLETLTELLMGNGLFEQIEKRKIRAIDKKKYEEAEYKCPHYDVKRNQCILNNCRCYALSDVLSCGIYQRNIKKRVEKYA